MLKRVMIFKTFSNIKGINQKVLNIIDANRNKHKMIILFLIAYGNCPTSFSIIYGNSKS